MAIEIIKVPDIGGADSVEVIEVSVAVGDQVAVDGGLIVLESDKASMEVPSPQAGEIASLLVKIGDKVSEGDAILEMRIDGTVSEESPAAEASTNAAPEATAAPLPVAGTGSEEQQAHGAPATVSSLDIIVPDLGGAENVEIIEITAAVGDELAEGDALLVMESDKASMELPAPAVGKLTELTVAVGGKLNSGDRIGAMTSVGAIAPSKSAATPTAPAPAAGATLPAEVAVQNLDAEPLASGDFAAGISALEKRQLDQRQTPSPAPASRGEIYAGPAVRTMARELGVELQAVSGSGPRGRILKEDLQSHVKQRLNQPAAVGSGIPVVPEIDFAQFGEVELVPMSGIQKATVSSMSRSWLNVPHVTHFDDADVTDLEEFRASLKPEMERRGIKLTPLPFMLKAAALSLREHPQFNASLHADGEHVVIKKYIHIGVAVDTPHGLMVPVIRDVQDKSLWDLAAETRDLAGKARERKLRPADLQGGCFSISSLGNIGGTGFTPIVNAPEVAILGVSRLAVQPVWNGTEFLPRKMLPLGLSYDHRQVNGAAAGAFMTTLCGLLGDLRRFALL